MRSKRYTANKLPDARLALGRLHKAISDLSVIEFNLRSAGDHRAAVGVKQATARLESWRGKVEDSINLSDPAHRQPISADEPGMGRIAE